MSTLLPRLRSWFQPSLAIPRISGDRRTLRPLFLLAVAAILAGSLPWELWGPEPSGSVKIVLMSMLGFGLLILLVPLVLRAQLWVIGLVVGRGSDEDVHIGLAGGIWAMSVSSLALLPVALLASVIRLHFSWGDLSWPTLALDLPSTVLQSVLWSRFLAQRWRVSFRRVLIVTLAVELATLVLVAVLARAQPPS